MLGTIKCSGVLYDTYRFIYRHFFRSMPNLIEKYGENTWAVVTGASDGIGAEYCRQLAKLGFNIALVSRTMSKLEAVEREVIKLNPKVKTRIVQADFSGNATLKFYEDIFDKLKDLDISLLINNAGVMNNGLLTDISLREATDTLDVNVTHVAMMTKKFLNKLLSRK